MRVALLCCLLVPWVGAARVRGTGQVDKGNSLPPGTVLKPLLQGIGASSDKWTAKMLFQDDPQPLHRHRRSATLCDSERQKDLLLNGRMEIGRYSDEYYYDNNKTCTWVITARRPRDRIILISRAFMLEYSYNCRYDYVEIFDGRPVEENSVGKLCGRKKFRMISKSRKLTIKFKSDGTIPAPGFLFELSRLPSSSRSSSGCNNTITNNEGNITSPGRGPNSHYPDNTTCLYSLMAPQGQIRLTFVDFSLEEGSCIDDYLTVYDGYTSEAVEIDTYCGRKKPTSITSSSNRLLVVFHSNSFITSTGFKINYKHVSTGSTTYKVVEGDKPPEYDPDCSSIITEVGQQVRSPHFGTGEYYLQKRKCQTVIIPPAGRAVKVRFQKFDMEESLDCLYDHVNVSFNKKEDARKTVRLCGYHRSNSLCFLSVGGNVTLDFTSDVMFEGLGYRADYQFVAADKPDQNCMRHDCDEECQGYCYNNGNGIACACPNGKVPPDCSQNITWKAPLKRNLTIYEGTNLKLPCEVNHPHTYVIWDKDFETSGDTISMIPNENTPNMDVKGSWLIINETKMSDAGVYMCTVQAGETILRQRIKLIIKEEYKFCGSAPEQLQNPNTNAAVSLVAGKNATKAPVEIPWQVHLWNIKKEAHHCGGVLISETHVLTAAHCVRGGKVRSFKARDIRVSVGTKSCRTADAERRSISRYIIHPSYDKHHLKFDFALLELDKPIYVKSEKIYPICLPNSETWKDVYAGFKGIIAGCGKSKGSDSPEVLYMVDVPITNRSSCIRKGKVFTDDMFCAGGSGKENGDACSGDSGGGLTAKIKGRWTLLGLISFGDGCPGKAHGYYANVSYALDWIRQVAPICGRTRFIEGNSGDSKVVHGAQALPKQFPWAGALWVNKNYTCTVTLIGSNWAVTAHHCVDKTLKMKVVIGSLLRGNDNSQGARGLQVEEIRAPFQVDVALLKLEGSLVSFSDVIQPACLPAEPMVDDERGVIAGWGINDTRDSRYQENLLYAELAQVNCNKSKLAGREPLDVCFISPFNTSTKASVGDSGAGLITTTRGRHTLGAVYRAGHRNAPGGFYTRVLDLVPWIKEEIGWIEEEEEFCGSAPREVAEATETLSGISDAIPWHVLLWDTNKNFHHCGGVLISETHVLTSARCVGGVNFRISNIRVSVGTVSCSSTESAVQRRVSMYMLHPGFNKKTFENDFALLELEKPIYQKSREVYPICLPSGDTWKNVENGVIAGCGGRSGRLQMVKVPIANKTDCPGRMMGGKFCAGHKKAALGSACPCFNGGAFAAEVKGTWTLLGLMSLSESCRGSGFESYSDVAEAMAWIKSVAPICGRNHIARPKTELKSGNDKQKAVLKQFPWVGALKIDEVEYTCPVTLIGTRWAVTSGSPGCYNSSESYSVVFGTLSYEDEGTNSINIPVVKGFKKGAVTLLKFKDSLEDFSAFIQPACLPAETVAGGEKGLIAGWDQETEDLVFSEVGTNDRHLVSSRVFNNSAVMVDIGGRRTIATIKVGGTYYDVANSVPSMKQAMGWIQDSN